MSKQLSRKAVPFATNGTRPKFNSLKTVRRKSTYKPIKPKVKEKTTAPNLVSASFDPITGLLLTIMLKGKNFQTKRAFMKKYGASYEC